MAGERMDAGAPGGLSRRSVWALLAVLSNIVVAPGADGQVIIVDPVARETRTMSLGVPVVVLAIRATG